MQKLHRSVFRVRSDKNFYTVCCSAHDVSLCSGAAIRPISLQCNHRGHTMRHVTLFLATGCLFLACLIAPRPAQAQIAFERVHALTMTDDEVRTDWTVLVEGDRIVAAGPAGEVDVPATAQRIDGDGKYLMPGLAEMHGHVPSPNESGEYIESLMFLYVANGVTTVRGLLGEPGQLALKEATADGSLLGPALYLAGPAFNGGTISSPEQAERRVREQVAEGWDYLKVLPGMTREEFDAMARAANEEGIPFIGHVTAEAGLLHAIEMGQQTIDHLDGYIEYVTEGGDAIDPERLENAIALTKERNVWLVPTMALWETILGAPSSEDMAHYEELQYMPPEMVASWTRSQDRRRAGSGFDQARADRIAAQRIELLGALNEAGARILMGTDSPQLFSVPGFALLRELPLMADAGMSPYEILVSGTRAVGEYLREEDAFGTIAAGSRADLILLNSNPMEDAMRVFDRAGVMARGQWIPESEIQERLAAIAAGYR